MINYRSMQGNYQLTSYMAYETRDLTVDAKFFFLLRKLHQPVTYEQLVTLWQAEYGSAYPVNEMSARRDTLNKSFRRYCDEADLSVHDLVVFVAKSINMRNRCVNCLAINQLVATSTLEDFGRWLS